MRREFRCPLYRVLAGAPLAQWIRVFSPSAKFVPHFPRALLGSIQASLMTWTTLKGVDARATDFFSKHEKALNTYISALERHKSATEINRCCKRNSLKPSWHIFIGLWVHKMVSLLQWQLHDKNSAPAWSVHIYSRLWIHFAGMAGRAGFAVKHSNKSVLTWWVHDFNLVQMNITRTTHRLTTAIKHSNKGLPTSKPDIFSILGTWNRHCWDYL